MGAAITRLGLLVFVLFTSVGCKGAYYGAMEKFGWEKRDILVDRVEDAKGEQEAAKQQFKTTLERFQELTSFQGGELEAKYKKLSKEYDRCKDAADDVRGEIESVESVAKDMFAEWQKELEQYSNADLRRDSEQKLRDTQAQLTKAREALNLIERAARETESRLAAVSEAKGRAESSLTEGRARLKEAEASLAEASREDDPEPRVDEHHAQLRRSHPPIRRSDRPPKHQGRRHERVAGVGERHQRAQLGA